MPKRYFSIELGEGIEAHVYFETLNGLVISYIVKLLVWIGAEYYEVIRFDSAHGCPHKDILDPKGSVVRKVWFELLDNQQGSTRTGLGHKYLKDNYELYIERFKKWLKK